MRKLLLLSYNATAVMIRFIPTVTLCKTEILISVYKGKTHTHILLRECEESAGDTDLFVSASVR